MYETARFHVMCPNGCTPRVQCGKCNRAGFIIVRVELPEELSRYHRGFLTGFIGKLIRFGFDYANKPQPQRESLAIMTP